MRRLGPVALSITPPKPVGEIPGFAEGDVSVQDAGAQHAAFYLDARDGMRVLDACAAPGGKTGHLLERDDVELVALDNDAQRVRRIESNLARLGLTASLKNADATAIGSWWDGKPFDRILLDVPCSDRASSGAIRTSSGCAGPAICRSSREPSRLSSNRCGIASRRVVDCCMPPARYFRKKTRASSAPLSPGRRKQENQRLG